MKLQDVIRGVTVREEIDSSTGLKERAVIEYKDENLSPRCVIMNPETGEAIKSYRFPTGSLINVMDGDKIMAGDILAKIPREISKTRDITGGLPRVAELFEARRPKE